MIDTKQEVMEIAYKDCLDIVRECLNVEVGLSYFDFFSSKQPLNTSNFPQHFFAIATLFAKDCNYHISNFDTQSGILFISGHYKGKGNELMIDDHFSLRIML